MTVDTTQHALKQLSFGLGLLGLCCGFLMSYGVLAGDAEGQVNLLFVLLLFAFVPVAGLLLSLILVVRGGGKGFAGWILDMPLWPRHLTLALPKLNIIHGRKLWFFYQTQILSLSFGVGCILFYLLLLLGNDISFVWRSTLLEPEDLLPALQFISLPWSFWQEAQASLALIEQTRDFRLAPQGAGSLLVGLWWKYILAAQIVYNLIPRSIMLLVSRQIYLRRLRAVSDKHSADAGDRHHASDDDYVTLADLKTEVASPYTLLDWAGVPERCHAQIQQMFGKATATRRISAIAAELEDEPARSQALVVIVKSWEPPLAELADRLRRIDSNSERLILPLDWNEQGIRQAMPSHLDEWRRFTATLSNWQVLRLRDSI
ncbi:MAG: DUF2868 domain-containing protein [Pseudohongiellaceae bacterium]